MINEKNGCFPAESHYNNPLLQMIYLEASIEKKAIDRWQIYNW